METAMQEPSNPTKPVQLPKPQQQQEQQNQQKQQQQQEDDSRNQQVFYKAQKLLELSVTGVKAVITAEDLKTHFARFGDLVEVDLFINPTINKHNGSGYIRLRPTADTNHILKTEHIVCGVPINVKERSASDDSERNSVCPSLESANVQWEEEEKMKNPDIATGPTIFVGGIGRKLSSEAVREYFSRFGCVTKVRRAVVPSNGRQLAYGFVTFAKNTDISLILASKRHNVEGWDVESAHDLKIGQFVLPNMPG
ncbi:unnamed protein product [Dibothriocephalus latus]|uniref:RRM domain-containing protein n=1 Tax=Dibothriocephalus latus TaxID=60516 RepID=A0A3P7P4X1_DIBLA|nr:unnamed protein product [Dibothriocephalus latus]